MPRTVRLSQRAETGLLPEAFSAADRDRDGYLSQMELTASHDRAADTLPNYAIPEMNGVGAMEAPVTAALGLCLLLAWLIFRCVEKPCARLRKRLSGASAKAPAAASPRAMRPEVASS